MPWFYYVGRALIRVILILFTRWQVIGKENISSQGPMLIVANHLNLTDPPVLSVSIRRRVIFMAKKELFHFRVIGYFMRGFGTVPVHRGRLDRLALHQAEQVLNDGLALIMFPEGMRSRSGRLRPAFSGSARIALRMGIPIVPVGIAGTENIKGVAWMLRRPRITVNIGRPFRLEPVGNKLTKAELAGGTTLIMEHIAELLPPQYRGDYSVQGN